MVFFLARVQSAVVKLPDQRRIHLRSEGGKVLTAFGQLPLHDPVKMQRLVHCYNHAWHNEKRLRAEGFSDPEIEQSMRLHTNEELLRKEHDRFPEGQIVIAVKGNELSAANVPAEVEVIAGLLSTMAYPIRSLSDIPSTYDGLTVHRTFASHVPLDSFRSMSDAVPMLFCVSVAIDPPFQFFGLAQTLLNFGIEFAGRQGLIAAPFSAVRGYGAFLKEHPDISVERYLEWTWCPSSSSSASPLPPDYTRYLQRINFLNSRSIVPATYGKPLAPLIGEKFNLEQQKPAGLEAYLEFIEHSGRWFMELYGRLPTVVDYLRLTGRRHIDPVMDLHIQNGGGLYLRFARPGYLHP